MTDALKSCSDGHSVISQGIGMKCVAPVVIFLQEIKTSHIVGEMEMGTETVHLGSTETLASPNQYELNL